MGVMNQLVTATGNIATAIRGQGHIDLAPHACLLASTGGPMSVFANGASATPGPQITDSETFTVRWNNNATLTAIARNVTIPVDIDTTAAITFNCLVSKTGATVGDATTVTVAAWITKAGDLHDADADLGGVTSAVQGDATAKTITRLQRTLAASDIAASLTSGGPGVLAISFGPTGGTLGTDDFCMHAAWLTYTRKLSLS